MTKKSISYPDELDAVIEEQIDAGIADGHSDWFQEAAYLRLAVQGLSHEALGEMVSQDQLDPEEVRKLLSDDPNSGEVLA